MGSSEERMVNGEERWRGSPSQGITSNSPPLRHRFPVFSNRRMSLKREGAGGEKGSFRDRFFSKYIAVAGRWECGNRAAISKVVGSPGFGLSTTVISTAGFPRSFHFHRPKAV